MIGRIAEFESAIRGWVSAVVPRWRDRWAQASPPVRRTILSSLVPFAAPLQVRFYAHLAKHAPVAASAILFCADPARRDLDVEVTVIDQGGPWPNDCPPIVRGYLESFLGNMTTNWQPGRWPNPTPKTWHLAGWVLEGEPPTCFRVCAGLISDIEPEAFVAFHFKEEEPALLADDSASFSTAAVQHLWHAGEHREALALRRWLDPEHTGELLRALGLRGRPIAGWWCGLNLPRAELFAERADGDADLVAGVLEFDLTEDEWRDRLRASADRFALGAHPSNVENFAVLRAAADGRIVWPPRLDQMVACEVKASWYRTQRDPMWKATHVGERRRVMGQLRYLLDHGVDRVAFLHLGATEPRGDPQGNPWIAAGRDALEAEAALEHVFDPAELPSCGYFATVMGAVHFAEEDFAGAGGALIPIAPAQANPRATGSEAWRAALRERLGKLPRPPWPTAFVVACPSCGAWAVTAATSTAECSCGWRAS